MCEAGGGAGDGGAGAEAHVWGDGLGFVARHGAEGYGGEGNVHFGGRAAHSEDVVGGVAVFDLHGCDGRSLLSCDGAVGGEGVLGSGARDG